MTNANLEQLRYKAEVTYGTNAGGTADTLNFLTHGLDAVNESVMSNTVRADTNRAGVIRTGIAYGGPVAFEFQYGGYDPFIEAAFRNTFPTAFDTAPVATLSYDETDNSFNTSGTFSNLVVGQFIKSTGWPVPALNGTFRVASFTSTKIVVQGAALHNAAVTAAGTRRLWGTHIRNGIVDKSFSFERFFNYTSPASYQLLLGMRLGEFSLDVPTTGIITGSMSFLGGRGLADSDSSGFGGANAASTNEFFNSGNNIKRVWTYDPLTTAATVITPKTVGLTAINFSISTGAEALRQIGSLDVRNVRTGSISISGSLAEYYEALATSELTRKNNFSTFGFAMEIEDAAGQGYVFDFGAVKLGTGARAHGGLDSTQLVTYDIMPFVNGNFGGTGVAATVGVTRFSA